MSLCRVCFSPWEQFGGKGNLVSLQGYGKRSGYDDATMKRGLEYAPTHWRTFLACKIQKHRTVSKPTWELGGNEKGKVLPRRKVCSETPRYLLVWQSLVGFVGHGRCSHYSPMWNIPNRFLDWGQVGSISTRFPWVVGKEKVGECVKSTSQPMELPNKFQDWSPGDNSSYCSLLNCGDEQ